MVAARWNEEDVRENVHQLALVLVDTLDLHIEHGIRRDLDTGLAEDQTCESLLVGALDRCKALLEDLVINKLAQPTASRNETRALAERRHERIGLHQGSYESSSKCVNQRVPPRYSVMSAAKAGLAWWSQRRGVTPFVLFWNFPG